MLTRSCGGDVAFCVKRESNLVLPGVRWIDIKNSFGTNYSNFNVEQIERYITDWGPGVLIFALGYTEAFADHLRSRLPVWILDPCGAERLFAEHP